MRGRLIAFVGVALLLAGIACKHDSPTSPESELSGRWAASNVYAGCAEGDWSLVTLDLQQAGSAVTGTLTTKDGQVFPVTGSVNGNSEMTLDFAAVAPPPQDGFCSGLTFTITNVQRDTFSGHLTGRCCGTVVGNYQFNRTS